MKKIKLDPHGIQKSFYGKAKVEDLGTIKILISYNTAVAYIDARKNFHRLWNDYSLTTMNHIKAFCYEYGIIPNLWSANKKWWLSLPVDNLPKNIRKNTIFSMEEYKEQKEMEMWESRMRMFG